MADPIEGNLKGVRERIAGACSRVRRDPAAVRLIAVTKTFPASVVERAFDLGLRDFGENRVQELQQKAEAVNRPVRWHLIGHLQSNKAKVAARLCQVIHTVDSPALAEKLARESTGKALEVLIQVNIGGEEQKSGVAPEQALDLARAVRGLQGLRLCGLMTIPPISDESGARRNFRAMRDLRDRIRDQLQDSTFCDLSMGMTDDFEIAIEEGSTMIRVGRAIFGERT